MTDTDKTADQPRPLTFTLGPEQLVINYRYEVASKLNDIMIGLWFVVGSVLFFYPALAKPAIWCFLAGSIQLLIRPAIRIAKDVHLQRTPGSDWDY